MTKLDFLHKLRKEGKLQVVEPSEEMSQSYLIKSGKWKNAAQVVYGAELYEPAVSIAYYEMYNSVIALFFKCGIKCENHTASVILLAEIFQFESLANNLDEFRKERIDSQYYVHQNIPKQECKSLLDTAQKFQVSLLSYMKTLTNADIEN